MSEIRESSPAHDHCPGDRVSAVITTYNRPDYLAQAIQSVLDQTWQVHQIIVVDDASPNDLLPVIEQFDDQRLIYERLSVNSGPNRARNRGIELATSRWVAFLDDDDRWLPEKTATQLTVLEQSATSPTWIASVCSYRFLESGHARAWGATGRVTLDSLKTGNPYCGTSGLIARRDHLSMLKFDEGLPCGQDWDMFIRLAQAGNVIYLQAPLFLYRRGSHDSVTLTARSLSVDQLRPRLASIYKHRDWLGDRAFRQRVASYTLAYIPQKTNRLAWIKESIRLAGFAATARVLVNKMAARLLKSEARL